MIDTDHIGGAFERNAKALTRRPALGRNTAVSKVSITDGLTCQIEEGSWHLTADMPEQAGGSASGPTPGVLGRAAFGSCLAMGYVLHLSRARIPISGIEVEVEADFDDGALFGVSDSPAGYSDVRYTVTVHSDAAEADIARILDEADACSPYHDVFSRSQTLHRAVRVVPPSSE